MLFWNYIITILIKWGLRIWLHIVLILLNLVCDNFAYLHGTVVPWSSRHRNPLLCGPIEANSTWAEPLPWTVTPSLMRYGEQPVKVEGVVKKRRTTTLSCGLFWAIILSTCLPGTIPENDTWPDEPVWKIVDIQVSQCHRSKGNDAESL